MIEKNLLQIKCSFGLYRISFFLGLVFYLSIGTVFLAHGQGNASDDLIPSSVLTTNNKLVFSQTNKSVRSIVNHQQHSQAPYTVGSYVIFSFQSKNVSQVQVVFKSEQISVFHQMFKNPYGVYILVYPLKKGQTELNYKYIVNSIWVNDPQNPYKSVYSYTISFSHYQCSFHGYVHQQSPWDVGQGEYMFIYHGKPGQQIYLVGSFHNWSPFSDKMHPFPEDPSYYYGKVKLSHGKNYYYFLVDGQKKIDPKNPHLGYLKIKLDIFEQYGDRVSEVKY